MKKNLLDIFSIFENKKDTKIYSIKELNELRQRQKKVQLAKKSREYISELNKKQRLWLDKNNGKFRKVS
tara:strand:- start:237 stop:443 length:207 start_codon:yes stop_codon:yes gene_type:complete